MESNVFSGAKLAVLGKGQVLVVQRDHARGIAWPGLWDLPGGGREFGEGPVETALRETWEETRLAVRDNDIVWRREYPHAQLPGVTTWFLVASPGWLVLPPPRLGDEGQAVKWMGVDAFLGLKDAVPHLQDRLRDYLVETKVRVRAAE